MTDDNIINKKEENITIDKPNSIQQLLSNLTIEDKLKYALSTGEWKINKSKNNQFYNRLYNLQNKIKIKKKDE